MKEPSLRELSKPNVGQKFRRQCLFSDRLPDHQTEVLIYTRSREVWCFLELYQLLGSKCQVFLAKHWIKSYIEDSQVLSSAPLDYARIASFGAQYQHPSRPPSNTQPSCLG